MGQLYKIPVLLLALFFAGQLYASPRQRPGRDANVDLYESEKQVLLRRIDFERSRIANNYKSADGRLFNLLDSVTAFILEQPVAKDRRNLYLTRLRTFLGNINNYNAENYLKSGRYLAVLSYYPVMIGWDEKNELPENLKQYEAFSIKATCLIPGDNTAEDFLTAYLKDYPDDIFRFADDFQDRKFALPLLEKATKQAPESAKRYFTTPNTVSNFLSASKNKYAETVKQIYNRYGVKSRACLLLEPIVSENMSIEAADSIGNNPEAMFDLLVHRSLQNAANSNYSIYRFMDEYCVEEIRKISRDALIPAYNFESFRRYRTEEMFTILCYGYKEATPDNFTSMLLQLHNRCENRPFGSAMLASVDQDRLREFAVYCSQNKLLNDLTGMFGEKEKEYLLSLINYVEPETPMPPFKTFVKESPLTAEKTEDAPPATPKAQAIKPVLNETPADAKQLNSPKPVAAATVQPPAKPAVAETPNTTVKASKPADIAIIPAVPKANPIETVAKAHVTPLEINPKSEKLNPVLTHVKDDVYVAAIRPTSAKIEPIKIQLDAKTKDVIALKKNIYQSLQNVPAFINTDYAEDVLKFAAEKEPDEVFKKVEQFKSKIYSKTILEQCAINAPVSLKRYLYNSTQQVNIILHYSQNPVVKKIFEINQYIPRNGKPLLLLDDIVSGKLTVKDAVAISDDPNRLFTSVVKIISQPKFIGRYSIDEEMRDYSLRFIRDINDKLASGNTQAFSSVESFNSADLYFLMLYGRDELFSSTFNGLFSRFIQKMPNENANAFLHSVSLNQFRDFLSLCANYGRMEEFLSKFPEDVKGQLLISYISNLEQEKDDLSTIVLIAEAISNLKDYQLLGTLQSNIKSEYNRVKTANDQIGISIYGVLSSMISGNARVESNWYHQIAMQFKIAPVNLLASSVLFNSSSDCVEQMYFYDDEDGRSSFDNFLSSYKGQSAWMIEDKNTYVRIYSRMGMHVEIFADKPAYEQTGISDITGYMQQNNLVPTVIVHRGHSFHTEATLEKIQPSARLIFLGSCGGFYKISSALENAPEAHIIATRQIGTKTINDIMLFALNENIRSGDDIDWNSFWDQMHDKLGNNQYFSDYVPPHKNLEAIFIRAYYKTLGV